MPDDDDGGTDDTTGSAGQGDVGTDESTLDGGADGGDSTTDDEAKDPRVRDLSQENARRRNENKDLRRQLEEANAAKKALEDKEKSDLEKAQGDLAAATERQTKIDADLYQLRLENAFLTSNKHQWQDPKIALKLADLSEVKIDDDGDVTGLDKALDKLARDHAYLLKPKDDADNSGDQSTGSKVRNGSSGTPNRESLEKKYPALRR